MKFFDGFLVICAFALSTILTATLFATFSAWAYVALGPNERDIIAAATGGPPAAAASAARGNVSSAPGNEGAMVVEFEPITVIGHRHGVDDRKFAQSPGSVQRQIHAARNG